MNLDLSTRPLGDRAVVSVAGEVDLDTASELGEHALDALHHVSPRIVLDITGVTFMDSTGLKVLVSVERRAQLAGGSFVLVGASPAVLRILTLTGLDQVFTLHGSLEDLDD